MPSILTLFSGLKRAYAARAAAENSDDDSDEEASDDDLEVEELGSDEDDIDEEGVEYIEKLQKTRQSMEAEDDEVSYWTKSARLLKFWKKSTFAHVVSDRLIIIHWHFKF